MSIQGYNNVKIGPDTTNSVPKPITSRSYRGFSTVSTETAGVSLYDLPLIKQDLINHFHIRKGEKLENPNFGTIIWDILFEPLTEQVKTLITNDVTEIINSDPRIRPTNIVVTQLDYGIQIEATLTYLPYNIQETLRFAFDNRNGLI
jgi:phage baseplate assembly protein W